MNHYPEYTGGRLDHQSEQLLDTLGRSASTPISALTLAEARAGFVLPSWAGAPASVAAIRHLHIPGESGAVPLRVYVPHGRGPFPVTLFFHGGGFVAGTLDEFEPFCTRIADKARCLVASVDYRLAPEHKWPAAVDDALATSRSIAGRAAQLGGDGDRLALMGDSAGANLAAIAAIAARDEGWRPSRPPLLQVLISPWVDLSSYDSESFRLFGRERWLSTEGIEWYRAQYLASPEQALCPRASPLLARDLRGVCPALVVNAEFDVLHDQAEAYAKRLAASGVPVEHRVYRGTLHDFAVLPGLFDRASEAIDDICSALRAAFARVLPVAAILEELGWASAETR